MTLSFDDNDKLYSVIKLVFSSLFFLIIARYVLKRCYVSSLGLLRNRNVAKI